MIQLYAIFKKPAFFIKVHINKIKRMKTIYQNDTSRERTGGAILISDKLFFRVNTIIMD